MQRARNQCEISLRLRLGEDSRSRAVVREQRQDAAGELLELGANRRTRSATFGVRRFGTATARCDVAETAPHRLYGVDRFTMSDADSFPQCQCLPMARCTPLRT